MNDIPLQIPAYLSKFSSLSGGGIKFEFITQENINPELLTYFFQNKDKLGYLNYAVRQIEATDLNNLPKIDKSKYLDNKTPGQRLRNVIFILWQQEGSHGEFDTFYQNYMEKIINAVKDKLT